MDLKARVAYLQGLAEGYELKEGSKKERILLGVLDVLADIAADTESLKDRMGEMEDYLECLDEDLAEVEEFLFDDDFDADDDDDIFMTSMTMMTPVAAESHPVKLVKAMTKMTIN